MLQDYKIAQFNCRGYYKRLDHIKKLITNIQPEVICLQETNLRDDHTPTLNGYDCYCNNRQNANRASGGVSLFVKNSNHSERMDVNTELEIIICKVWLPNPITICNVYIPPDHNTEWSHISEI